eukprot:jgi/Botrbrau1/19624/Bobra.0828s0001.1
MLSQFPLPLCPNSPSLYSPSSCSRFRSPCPFPIPRSLPPLSPSPLPSPTSPPWSEVMCSTGSTL